MNTDAFRPEGSRGRTRRGKPRALASLAVFLGILGAHQAPGDRSFLHAQDAPTRQPETADTPSSNRSDVGSRWTSYGMGIAIGAAGFTGGALIGAALEGNCDGFACADEAFLVGSAFGALGAGAGVHLGNGSRGNVWLTLLTSAGTGMAGAAAAVAINDEPGSVIVAVSTIVVQLVATTEVERATGRSRVRNQRASAAADSGVRLALGLSPTVKRGAVGAILAGSVRF